MLIRDHGADAELFAAQHADLMLERGDRDGQLVWMRAYSGRSRPPIPE